MNPQVIDFEGLVSLLSSGAPRTVKSKRIIVGICGKPGAGKSSLSARLQRRISLSTVVPLDGFHLSNKVLSERGLRERKGCLDSFDPVGFSHLLRRIASDDASDIFFPVFHREVEESIAAEGVVTKDDVVVLVEGIWLFREEFARNLLDVKIFVDVPHDVRIERLVERSVALGKSESEARAWALGPDEENAKLIDSTFADWIFQN
jgi:pantothenate kinase